MSFGFSVIVGNWVVTLLEHHGHSKRAAAIAGSLTLLLGFFTRVAGGALLRRPDASRWVAGSLVVGGRRRRRARAAAAVRRCSSSRGGRRARRRRPVREGVHRRGRGAAGRAGAAVGFVNGWASLVDRRGHAARRPHVLAAGRRADRLRRPRRRSRLWPRSRRRGRLAADADFGVTVLPDPPYHALARADQARRVARLRVRVDVRLARALAGVDPDAGGRGARDVEDQARPLRHESRRRATRRCSRARTRRCTTSPTAAWRWASAAATPRCATSAGSR